MTNLATAESLFFSALAAQEKQDFVTAERLYREALSFAPDRPSIVNNLAAVLFQLKRFEDSRSLCERQLELRPDDATLRVLLGNAFAGLRDFTPALQCYDSVLRSAPDHLDALINNAHLLESMGRPLDALTHLNRALELQPHHVDALNNRGNVLTDLNRFDEALRDYQQAQQAAPASARAYWNEAVCRLFLGEFERGWALYNHGWNIGQRGIGKPAFTQPAWSGAEPAGTLLVWGEQGIGDQILFGSMLDDLRDRADSIVVALERRLVPLFRRSFPDFRVFDLEKSQSLDGIDRQIAFGDLGRLLRSDWHAFPDTRNQFLYADREQVAAIRAKLGGDQTLICGFSWASANPDIGQFKSLTHADLSPLAVLPGIRWVDLQYGDTRTDRSRFLSEHGLEIAHIDEIDNFYDIDGLAALISACDIVITVSNTTAHLAGALGVPAMVMLPQAVGRIWYWHRDQTVSSWYPSCRLIRQATLGDWAPVIGAITDELRKRTALHEKSSSN